MTGSITHLIEQQQSFSLDLGVGQLRFKSGRVAEFQLNSSSSSMFSPAGTAEAGRAGSGEPNSSGLTADALSQLGGVGFGELLKLTQLSTTAHICSKGGEQPLCCTIVKNQHQMESP